MKRYYSAFDEYMKILIVNHIIFISIFFIISISLKKFYLEIFIVILSALLFLWIIVLYLFFKGHAYKTYYDDNSIVQKSFKKEKYIKISDIKTIIVYNKDMVLLKDEIDPLSIPKSNIKREIIDIEVEDDIVTITTVEDLVKDNKLYNILTNEVVKNYKKDSLSKYEDELNKISYVFDNKKLDRLEE